MTINLKEKKRMEFHIEDMIQDECIMLQIMYSWKKNTSKRQGS